MPRHRTSHTSEPPEDDLVKVLPRTSYPALPTWIDNLVTKINHLVQLLTNADDLPRSAHGWVFLRALRRYDGPAVPGNQDPQTNQIVHSHPFSLTSRNSAIDFTEKVLGGMAAYDRRKRLTLGEAIDHNNKASIVVALTSQLLKRVLISIHQPVPRAHLNTVDPIPLAALPPFGVYYCHPSSVSSEKEFDRVYTLPGLRTPATSPSNSRPQGKTQCPEKSSPHLLIKGDSLWPYSSLSPLLPVPAHNGFGLRSRITSWVLLLSHWNPLTSTAPSHSTMIG